jgi:hypothetical protein
MLAEWIHAVNALGDIDGRQHIVDPTLPRDGTDFMTLRVVLRPIDPTLPRDGTDFMTLRVVMRIVNWFARVLAMRSGAPAWRVD